MADSKVNQAGTASAHTNVSSAQKTLTGVASGAILVAVYTHQTNQWPTGISDSVNGSWTAAAVNADAGNLQHGLSYFVNSAGGSITITISWAVATDFQWNVIELGNVATTAALDGSSTAANGSVTSHPAVGVQPTVAGIVIATSGLDAAFTLNTEATGYTLISSADRQHTIYKVRTAGGAPSETATWTSVAAVADAIALAIFKNGTGGGAQNYTLTAASGSFVLTGTAATLKADRRLAAASGSFTLTGTAASLLRAAKLAAESGAFLVTGTAATLTYGQAVSNTMITATGTPSRGSTGSQTTTTALLFLAAGPPQNALLYGGDVEGLFIKQTEAGANDTYRWIVDAPRPAGRGVRVDFEAR